MYQSFYGFTEMPFNITPDPKFLFLSPTHQEALQHLKFGVRERKGFIVLIGEVGCGKTTLCRRFLNELDPVRFDTALILNPRVTETQMLKAILVELGETKLARSQWIAKMLAAGKKPEDVLDQLYLRAYTRRPSEAEKRKLLALVAAKPRDRQGYDDIFWAILNSSEFEFNH